MLVLQPLNMAITDEYIMGHLRENAVDGQIHIVYQQIADELSIGRNTVYRSINRLRNNGNIAIESGSDKKGYTYRICTSGKR